MKIRKGKVTDIPFIFSMINGEKTIEDYSGEYSRKFLEQMFHDKNTSVLVAEENNKVIAFAECKIDLLQKRMYLETITVSKAQRGRGIALLLIKSIETYAKKKKLKHLSFIVRAWNKPMNDLAKRTGYRKKAELVFWHKKI